MNLHNCPTVSPAIVAHTRRYRTCLASLVQAKSMKLFALYIRAINHNELEGAGQGLVKSHGFSRSIV